MIGKKELSRRAEGTALTPFRPMRELQELRDLMSSAFEDFFAGDGGRFPVDLLGGRGWLPAVDVEETEKEYIYEVEMPGLEKNDIKLEAQAGALIISGERKEKKEEKGLHYVRSELYHGEFRRKIMLPDDANPEAIKAVCKNGILTVTVPRSEQAKPKAIHISES